MVKCPKENSVISSMERLSLISNNLSEIGELKKGKRKRRMINTRATR
jgi:hypothetical protein